MRDDEDAAAIRQEIAFEPFQHVHIEMVRRFVEEEIVRTTHQGFRQIDARLLAAGKTLDRTIHVGFRKSEAADDFTGHRFVLIAAEPFKPFLHPGITIHQSFVVGTGLHLFFKDFQILFQAHDVLPSLGNQLPQGNIIGIGHILL